MSRAMPRCWLSEVPKAVTLYKSKVIEGYIKEWQAKLADESLTEEQQNEVIQRLAGFNKVKVTIARKLTAADLVAAGIIYVVFEF